MPTDFLSDDNQEYTPQKPRGRDFLEESEPEKEGLITSLALAGTRMGEDLLKGGRSFINKIPERYHTATKGLSELFDVEKNNPQHKMSQTLAGFHEAVNSLAQAPKGITRYLEQRLNLLPEGSEKMISKLLPNDLTERINKEYGEPKTEGDILLRNVIPIAGGLSLGSSLLKGGTSLGKSAINTLIGESPELKALESQRNLAQTGLQTQQETIDATKRKLQETGAGTTPESIGKQIFTKEEKLKELNQIANTPYQETKNLLNWPTGEDILSDALTKKENLVAELQKYLGKDEKLDVDAAKQINEGIEKDKKKIQNKYYKPAEKYIEKSNVLIPRLDRVKEVELKLKELSTDPVLKDHPEFENFEKAIRNHPQTSHDIINAKDFYQQWKETKQASSAALRKGFKPGGDNQTYWQKQGNNLKKIADDQWAILEENLPKKISSKLTKGDQLWKEEIIPFYGNKIYEQSKKLGRVDTKNIMQETRGVGMGQEQMKNLFLSNPDMTRRALGMSYASEPEKLLNAGVHEKEFLGKLPKLQEMLGNLQEANKGIESAESKVSELKVKRKTTEELHNYLVNQQVERQRAIEQSEKLKRDIEELAVKKNLLKSELNKGSISKKEFERLDRDYQEKINAHKAKKKRISKILTVGLGALGGKQIYDYLSK